MNVVAQMFLSDTILCFLTNRTLFPRENEFQVLNKRF